MSTRPKRLEALDLTRSLSPSKELARLQAAQARLLRLRLACGGQLDAGTPLGPPVCLVFEGWDAAGKGGAIRRLVAALDPRHVRVTQVAAPTKDELRHHFLWRFWPQLPGKGGMAVFDRSWYGRVLVERVEGFATTREWRRAYQEINEFERTLADSGMVIIKFFLHISDEEQARRFARRHADPLKSWKLTDEDWRNRGRRDDYEAAINEMVARTDSRWAPWTLIEAEDKRFARVRVLEATCEAVEAGLLKAGIALPTATREQSAA